jgi:hypothetical protein
MALLEQRAENHPNAACELMASRRRYLSDDEHGRPRLDAAKVKAAEKFDGEFVVVRSAASFPGGKPRFPSVCRLV